MEIKIYNNKYTYNLKSLCLSSFASILVNILGGIKPNIDAFFNTLTI